MTYGRRYHYRTVFLGHITSPPCSLPSSQLFCVVSSYCDCAGLPQDYHLRNRLRQPTFPTYYDQIESQRQRSDVHGTRLLCGRTSLFKGLMLLGFRSSLPSPLTPGRKHSRTNRTQSTVCCHRSRPQVSAELFVLYVSADGGVEYSFNRSHVLHGQRNFDVL